jgi:hypothetical protein
MLTNFRCHVRGHRYLYESQLSLRQSLERTPCKELVAAKRNERAQALEGMIVRIRVARLVADKGKEPVAARAATGCLSSTSTIDLTTRAHNADMTTLGVSTTARGHPNAMFVHYYVPNRADHAG